MRKCCGKKCLTRFCPYCGKEESKDPGVELYWFLTSQAELSQEKLNRHSASLSETNGSNTRKIQHLNTLIENEKALLETRKARIVFLCDLRPDLRALTGAVNN